MDYHKDTKALTVRRHPVKTWRFLDKELTFTSFIICISGLVQHNCFDNGAWQRQDTRSLYLQLGLAMW